MDFEQFQKEWEDVSKFRGDGIRLLILTKKSHLYATKYGISYKYFDLSTIDLFITHNNDDILIGQLTFDEIASVV